MYSSQYRESLNTGPMAEVIRLVLFHSIKLILVKKLRPSEKRNNCGHYPKMHCLPIAPNISENISYTSEILVFWCLDIFNIIIFLKQHSPKQCVSSAIFKRGHILAFSILVPGAKLTLFRAYILHLLKVVKIRNG